jgi:hypothetical protein
MPTYTKFIILDNKFNVLFNLYFNFFIMKHKIEFYYKKIEK